jgi:SAM-dependent methyltransferase
VTRTAIEEGAIGTRPSPTNQTRGDRAQWIAGLRRRVALALVQRGRRRLARAVLRGRGVEIGALHSPFPLPPGASAVYVDRLPADQLRLHYAELGDAPLVPVDIVDDAETLATIPAASQDFVIASHLLEHCEDPIGAVLNWLRVVRPGGVVVLAVPDRRHSFDRTRPATPLAHVVRDHRDGPQGSREEHYLEWARAVEGRTGDDAPARAEELRRARYSIHFHVWDHDALAELLEHCLGLPQAPAAQLELRRNRSENLAVLRRLSS